VCFFLCLPALQIYKEVGRTDTCQLWRYHERRDYKQSMGNFTGKEDGADGGVPPEFTPGTKAEPGTPSAFEFQTGNGGVTTGPLADRMDLESSGGTGDRIDPNEGIDFRISLNVICGTDILSFHAHIRAGPYGVSLGAWGAASIHHWHFQQLGAANSYAPQRQ